MEKRTGDNVTPERRQIVKSAQAKRRQRLKEAAQKVGFDTIDKLADAILSDEVTIIKKGSSDVHQTP